MHMTNIRMGKKPFSDMKRFPYGFKKSGDFSISEAETLAAFGETLNGLESGLLMAESEDELHFLQVMRGQVAVQSSVEKVWLKYAQLSRTRKAFFTLHSACVKNDMDIDDDGDFVEEDLSVAV